MILDTVVSNAFSWKSSELTTGFVELVEFVISTLIGYVFSEVQKRKKDQKQMQNFINLLQFREQYDIILMVLSSTCWHIVFLICM